MVSTSDAEQLAELEAETAEIAETAVNNVNTIAAIFPQARAGCNDYNTISSMANQILAENITWLRESLPREEDAGRRSDAEALLSVATQLTKRPSKNALRQIAK